MPDTLIERFWANVQKGDGCWLWTAHVTRGGYGSIRADGRQRKATHVAIFLRDGAWPPSDKVVCHSCDNPACVRPDHLWVGTVAENNADRNRKGRTVVSSPPAHQRARGERHGSARLTRESVLLIRSSPLSSRELGGALGVSYMAVQRVRNGRTWRHV